MIMTNFMMMKDYDERLMINDYDQSVEINHNPNSYVLLTIHIRF